MTKKRIPRLQTDQAAAAYWERQSFADVAEDTTEANIRFAKKPKRTIRNKSTRPSRLRTSSTGNPSLRSR
ncbi:hypothetical protein MELA_00469 [Candidatus Methylomirabilis lanthanidiphila]|uniref:Uncharacterized protein n=1 Tax=Candidatus Methylomirabilis lanthanidiphila TaxID=2211376 RepID=A0A564ZFP9_9BACT|nr:hypothetical protein MELA_00469 [Candidatus Methylomirabilis lanthanidiphila]